MLNQHGYGKMDVDQVPKEGGPVWGMCAKCNAKFLLEKPHKEVSIHGMIYRRKPDKNLTPTKPTDLVAHRFCNGCYKKFEQWISE